MKTCKDCNQTKSLSEFYIARKDKGTYKSYCKICDKKRGRNWAINNPDRMNELNRHSYQRNKDGHFSVYLLPDHNYVGLTGNIADRKRKHRNYHNRKVSNIKILHIVNTWEEGKILEDTYHALGYAGAKLR